MSALRAFGFHRPTWRSFVPRFTDVVMVIYALALLQAINRPV